MTAANASHIHVGSNEFTASGTPPAAPAIRILGGDGHAVLANSFYDFSFRPVIDVQGVDPKGHRVQANFTYP